MTKADARLAGQERTNRDFIHFKQNLPIVTQTRRNQVFDNLMLTVHRHCLSLSQVGQVDAMKFTQKTEIDPFVAKSFLFQPLADSGVDEKLNRPMFQNARPDSRFDIRPTPFLENNRLDPMQIEQLG
jgi:hypothetical protein